MASHIKITVVKNEQEARGIHTLTFDCSLESQPGQFLMLWLPGIDEKPFSIENSSPLRMTIASVGEFSGKLVSLKKGSSAYIRGPYGNSFDLKNHKKICVVGGGYGIAPLRFLVRTAKSKGLSCSAIMGARSKDYLVSPPDCETAITTDDGSAGQKGFVTDALPRVLAEQKPTCVYICGPEKMMISVAKACMKKGIEFQLSAEREMKCGVGICGHCAIGRRIVCREGTVFGKEIFEEDEFGKVWREWNGKTRPL